MRRSLVLALPLAVVSSSLTLVSAPAARADDACATFRDMFSVQSAAVDHRAVSVSGLNTVPMTFTITTRAHISSPQPAGVSPWGEMMLYQVRDDWMGETVPLRKVAEKGEIATWRGVLQAGGPSRDLTFDGMYGQVGACNQAEPMKLPRVRVKATNTPVLRMQKVTKVSLAARSYVLRGQVLSSSGRTYGRRLTVRVGRGTECDVANQGVAVRTDTAGRFSATMPNRPEITVGAPVIRPHCVRLPGTGRDAFGRPADLVKKPVTVPWSHTFKVTAPKTVKRGSKVVVRSSAALPAWTTVRLERLDGRTWRQVGWGPIRDSGRMDVEMKPAVLGRHTYRLRTLDSKALSPGFVMTTTR